MRALVLTLFLPAWGVVASQTLSFQPPIYLQAASPACVLIADVNGDGKNDILAAGAEKLWVFLADSAGKFTAAADSPYPAGPSPNDLALGDFNRDGNLDVAVANHGVPRVTVLLGDGHGGFMVAPGSPFAVTSNPHPHGIAAADFDGDGKLDLAVDSWAEDKILVLFGNGDGTFQSPGVKFNVGKHPYERVRVADINGDGHPDIITANFEENSVTVLLGDGKGGFAFAGGRNVPVPPSPFGVAIGDFNGDHHPDIAVNHYSGHGTDPGKDGLSVLWGDGKGNFTLAKGSPLPTGHYPGTIAAGDLNGDGITDIALPNAIDNTVTIYLGGSTGLKQAPGSPLHVGRQPTSVAIGLLNDDAVPDLVIANMGDNNLMVLFGKHP